MPSPVMLSALALELFHNVSLAVDDLLDRSRYRHAQGLIRDARLRAENLKQRLDLGA